MTDLITIFCEIDDFCKEFESQFKKKLLSRGKGQRNRKISLTLSEVMTILIWYHFSGYATFKDYYTKHVTLYLKEYFPTLTSYQRFVELKNTALMPLLIFLITKKLSSCTGISFIDSFKLEASHIKRASSNKTLKGIAKKGKTSVGWFYGMKTHIVFNHKAEIISFYISSGNVSDNNEQVLLSITKNIFGKLFGDKGYLVKEKMFKKLFDNGVQLITKIRSNMKNRFISLFDKFLLNKRGIVESAGDILKGHLLMEHTRHRSVWGFLLHIFSSLTAYQLRDKKPKINLSFTEKLISA